MKTEEIDTAVKRAEKLIADNVHAFVDAESLQQAHDVIALAEACRVAVADGGTFKRYADDCKAERDALAERLAVVEESLRREKGNLEIIVMGEARDATPGDPNGGRGLGAGLRYTNAFVRVVAERDALAAEVGRLREACRCDSTCACDMRDAAYEQRDAAIARAEKAEAVLARCVGEVRAEADYIQRSVFAAPPSPVATGCMRRLTAIADRAEGK